VSHPERVRLKQVTFIELPSDPKLFAIAKSLGLGKGTTWGRTFRYGISLRHESWNDRHKLLHELVHTKQYEILGSIQAFVRRYFAECLPPSRYGDGPLEKEAERVANEICGIQHPAR
jgi:hypothetical protein